MGGSDNQSQSTEEDEFDETLEEIHKIWENRVSDITDAYIESGKNVEWYIHFIRCLDSIKKGPPAKDMDVEDQEDDTGNSRSRKRQRADSTSPTPSDSDSDADEGSPEPAGTVGKTLTTNGPATYRVVGPATLRIKTEGDVAFRMAAAATLHIEEARQIQVKTESAKFPYHHV